MIDKDMEIVSFETLLRRDVTVLKLIGLHSMDDVFTAKTKKPKIWESVVFEIGLINLGMVVWSETRRVIDLWGKDPEYIIGALSAIVSGSLCLIKGWRFWFWREELRKLLRGFAILWEEANIRERIRKENLKMATDTSYVTKLNIIMVTILCISYAVRPYILLITHNMIVKNTNETYDYTVTVYAATYPWPTGTTTKYIICVCWEQFSICFVALYWMASDITFAQLTTHTAIQFRVLWHDLQYITNSEGNQDDEYEKKLIARLSRIVERHCDLYTYCDRMQHLFNPIVFLTLSFTAAHMCLCAFHLQKEMAYRNWEEVAKSLLHTVTVIIQAFMYCAYSHKLTEQSSLMAQAAYECKWIHRSKEFKIMLGIIMMRSQKPFICSGYGFFFVNLSQMTSIFKAAGSYFTLLQSMT